MEKIDISDDVKIIVRITNKMIGDYEECERKLEVKEETADCSKCSLDASIGGISLCQIDEITGEIKKKMIMNEDLISRKELIEEIKSLRVTIIGARAGKGILDKCMNEYKDSILRIINEQAHEDMKVDTIHKAKEIITQTIKYPRANTETVKYFCPNCKQRLLLELEE